jgi:hypothetical protein
MPDTEALKKALSSFDLDSFAEQCGFKDWNDAQIKAMEGSASSLEDIAKSLGFNDWESFQSEQLENLVNKGPVK